MRPVRLRYNEHRRDAINKTANTPFGDHFGKEHIQDQLHTNQNILDLKVLYRALDHPDRKIAESIYIRYTCIFVEKLLIYDSYGIGRHFYQIRNV